MCYVRESVTISLCFIVKQTQLSISGGCGGVPPLSISRVSSLHRAPTPRGAQSQLLKKKKKKKYIYTHLVNDSVISLQKTEAFAVWYAAW